MDHDHVTHHIRGILCCRCNMALGLVDESAEHCNSAMLYLRLNGHDSAFGKKSPTPKACSGYIRGGDARGPCDKAAQILCDACGHAYCDDHGCACPA